MTPSEPDSAPHEFQSDLEEQELSMQSGRIKLLPKVVLAGLLAGMIAVVFRIAIREAEKLRQNWLESTEPGWTQFCLLLLVATSGTLFATLLVRHVSQAAGGSGIPHLKAVLLHMRRFLPFHVLGVKFFGGIAAIGSGLALGREGPTIQMGGAAGKIVGRLFGMTRDERFILIAAGSAAGLSAAFNAPLAGLVFVLEEIQRTFHRRIFFSALLASVVGDTVSRLALGQEPVFDIPSYPIPDLKLLPAFLALGVIAGFTGILFNRSLNGVLNAVPRIFPKKNIVLIAIFCGLAVASVGSFDPSLLGSGHEITEEALGGHTLLGALFLMLLLRFALTMISYASGAPGGIFAPLLVLGAGLGLAFALLLENVLPFDIPHPGIFAVIGMAALFSATVQAPLTGIVLIVEMTGEHSLMLPLLVACLTAYLITERFGCPPIYQTLMDRELDDYRKRVSIREQLESDR